MEIAGTLAVVVLVWTWIVHLTNKQKADEEKARDLLARRREVAARNQRKIDLWWERNRKRRSWAHLTRAERRAVIEWGAEPYAEVDPGISLHSVKTKMQYAGRQSCYLCEVELHLFSDDIHLDHIVPIANGGTHTWDNVALVHAKCNVKKGVRSTSLRAGRKGPLPNRSLARLKREKAIEVFFDTHRGAITPEVSREYARLFPDPERPPLTRRPRLEEPPVE